MSDTCFSYVMCHIGDPHVEPQGDLHEDPQVDPQVDLQADQHGASSVTYKVTLKDHE